MSKKHIPLIPVVLILFVFWGSAFSEMVILPDAQNTELGTIRYKIEDSVDSETIPSVSIGVFEKGRVIWRESFGWADREKKIKAAPDTVYALASLSKSLTATGVFKLIQEGKLSLDSPIDKTLRAASLKYYRGHASDYKVFHLLNMVAGIPHYWLYQYDDSAEPPLSVVQQIENFGFAAFGPGEVHHYSNASFAVLDQIIADVSGKSFPEFMRSQVFEPTGMTKTWADRSLIPLNGVTVAKGYDTNYSEVPLSAFIPRGGAGYFSTVDDLLKYGLLHLKHPALNSRPVLNPETIDKNHEVLPELPFPYYANGWGVLRTPEGNTTLLSNGAIAGAATTLLVIPESDIVVVCLVNMSVGNEYTDQIAIDIAGALIPQYKTNLEALFSEVGPLFEAVKFSPDRAVLGRWQGLVNVDEKAIPISLDFEDDGAIYVSLNGQEKIPVTDTMAEMGLLTGNFDSKLESIRLNNLNFSLSFSIIQKNDQIYGIIFANIKGDQPQFIQPFYVELKKTSE